MVEQVTLDMLHQNNYSDLFPEHTVTMKDIRMAFGFTQEQLAKVTEVSVNSISSYERGIRTPGTAVLQILSHCFHIPMERLLDVTKKE